MKVELSLCKLKLNDRAFVYELSDCGFESWCNHIDGFAFFQPAFTFKVTVETSAMYEICSNLTIKTPERHRRRHSGVLISNIILVC